MIINENYPDNRDAFGIDLNENIYYNGYSYYRRNGKFRKKKHTGNPEIDKKSPPIDITETEYYEAYHAYYKQMPKTVRDRSTTNRHSDHKGYMDRRPYEPKE